MKIYRTALLASVLFTALGAIAQDTEPKHLQLARDFVANTKQENNSYSNTHIYTRMPGDLFASEYVVATDCGGFVEDMFRRAKSGVLEQLKTKKFKTRFSIFDWHPSIEKEEAFTRIRKVPDIQPGDVAVWLYMNMGTHTLPGHMLFIDSVPVTVSASANVISSTSLSLPLVRQAAFRVQQASACKQLIMDKQRCCWMSRLN